MPVFILQLIASTAFALLLVFFRHSRIDFWGVVLCVLMLRGPQTVAELRTRSERLYPFASAGDVEATLRALAAA